MLAGSERGRTVVAVLGLFTVATVWVLWPLARHGADHILDVHRFYGGAGWLLASDPWLYMWVLGWDTHALLSAPTRLFHANIFHPAPLTLALSDHLLGYWPLFAPFYLATGNPVAGYAATLLLSFVLSGAAMCWLVRHWTGSWAAGVVAGFVFAFAPWRLSQLAHMQLLGLYGLPLVLLFWDRSLESGRVRDLAGLGGAFLVQCLCSYYLAYCTVIVTATYAAITALRARPGRVIRATVALGLGAAAFTLTSLPYVWVRASGLVAEPRPAAQVASVPSWRVYVSPIAIGPAIHPYQGRVALALAGVGLVAAMLRRERHAKRVVALAAILVAGYLLALGPSRAGPSLYDWLCRWLPGFSMTRVPARFVIVVAFSVAGLAGIGWAVGVGRLPAAVTWTLSAALCALLAWDLGLTRFTLPVTPVGALPPVYGWLAEHGAGRPLLELPVRSWRGDLVGNLREQRYAWASIRHWLPHLSGRSGYFPPSYDLILPMARRLPDPAALDALVSLTGLHWIVVHGDDMRWDDRPMEGLELASTFGSDRVYRVNRRPSADWQAELVRRLGGSGESATFAGAPLRPLPSRDLRADFTRVDLPQRSPPRLAVPATITVRNRGRRTWPGLALATDRLVLLRTQWRDSDGRRVGPAALPALRLTADVPPGEEVSVSAMVPVPPAPGRYRLVVRSMQGGRVGGRAARVLEVVGS